MTEKVEKDTRNYGKFHPRFKQAEPAKEEDKHVAAIPVTFQGILCFSDVGVGGGPMPGGPIASHPIAPGGPPPGYWGGVAPPHPDQGLPGQPPGI
jgi:hypothetical protein